MTDQAAATRPGRRFAVVFLRWLVICSIVLVFFWATGCMERMFYLPTVEPTPVSAGPAGTEGVWFESGDGTRLYGWFIPAQHDGEGLAPTILHVHGNAGNVQHHVWFTEHLPPAGFNVFIFDYRGYGQSEGRATRREGLIADTHAALDVLLGRDDVDPRCIGMYGQSLGAAIGINVMADRPEIAAAVFESPFASWRDIAATAVGGDPPGLIARTLAAAVIRDHARPEDAIAKISRPMLILHGDADTIIPVSHGRRLARVARGHAELEELPDGDHNTLRMTHTYIDQRMVEFFAKHLR
jgi:dipeptidyl aminopeptidase/acylaminoacyl peptidase